MHESKAYDSMVVSEFAFVKSMLLRNAFVMLWAKPVSGNPWKGFAKRSRRDVNGICEKDANEGC